MKALVLTKRNMLELIKDPLATVFFMAFPAVLFIVLQAIMKSIGAPIEATPQFEITNFTSGMIIFSFSFVTIFVANNLALDRESSFLARLKASPLKGSDYIIGYTISLFPIIFVQEILMVIIGLCFGLEFSIGILYMILVLFPCSLVFIAFGIIIGLLVNAKAAGSMSSMAPTFVGLLGGIFFPLDTMKGSGFYNFCYALPFSNMINLGRSMFNGTGEVLYNILIVAGYAIVLYVVAIVIFNTRLKGDKI